LVTLAEAACPVEHRRSEAAGRQRTGRHGLPRGIAPCQAADSQQHNLTPNDGEHQSVTAFGTKVSGRGWRHGGWTHADADGDESVPTDQKVPRDRCVPDARVGQGHKGAARART